MEVNKEKELALQFIEYTDANIFLTGKAGTGKTTFLKEIRDTSRKRMVVLAPTGIAAINAGGMTIHSFFQLPFAPYVPESSFRSDGEARYKFHFRKERLNLIKSVDLIVIDEISMVRADLLDAIDNILRRFRNPLKPFGGVQLLMIGDLQQLPPVAKEDDWDLLRPYYDSTYFFSSHALKKTSFIVIELKKVYRQQDPDFLSILNRIRDGKCDKTTFDTLSRRYIPGFVPPPEESYIKLTTHNASAQETNMKEMAKLPGREYSFRARVEGKFPEYSFPTEELLTLKEGAQIMFVKNGISDETQFYNGMLGKITGISENGINVCRKDDDTPFRLKKETWTNAKYVLDAKTGEIVEVIEGTFTQYPVKLAWAVTIHKSQGLTFDKAIIDAASAFAHGQTYVALSRCRTLEGIVLDSPLSRRAVICDWRVSDFLCSSRDNEPNEGLLEKMKKDFYMKLIDDLFDFRTIMALLEGMESVLKAAEDVTAEALLLKMEDEMPHVETSLVKVADSFRKQYGRLLESSEDHEGDPYLRERIMAGAAYFLKESEPLRILLKKARYTTDDKERKKRFRDNLSEARRIIALKTSLLNVVAEKGLDTTTYLEAKCRIMK